MREDHQPPWWVPPLFGFSMIFMGLLTVYLLIWEIPASHGAANAPSWVFVAIAGALILGGIMMIIPQSTPSIIRSVLGFGALTMAVIVCNWTAFAPGVNYTSEVSLGPVSVSGDDQIGGRIAFGLAALVVDAVLAWSIIYEVKRRFR